MMTDAMAARPGTTRRAVVILAAGKGTRMKSRRAKVLHEVLGTPMLGHVVALAEHPAVGADRVIVVVGHDREAVEGWLASLPAGLPRHSVEQVDPRGTGHAVRFALPHLDDVDEVVVLYGDAPLLGVDTLVDLIDARGDDAMSLLAADVPDATGYGRVVLGADGTIARIVEHKDADAATLALRLVNGGMVCVEAAFLRRALGQLSDDNAQGELYLTELPALAVAEGRRANAARARDWREILGCNSRAELATATALLRERVLLGWMARGVSVTCPERTWVEVGVELGVDVTLGADVELRGRTRVGDDVRIDAGCVLVDTVVEDGAHVLPYVVATDSVIGAGASVGPFSHLRPGTVLGRKTKIGNFVETKKATFGDGAKASHLAYIGDATVGARCNIGAGTITCNYDGKRKHQTVLGDGVFIGSDSQLVAPVQIGAGAYVGAGSTITGDVPAGALALSRSPQKNIEGWVARKAARDVE